MALPTAPLGQLPTMNMPYSIPTYEVRRGRDAVLQALLVNLASGIGQQAVDNAMSRDFATEPAGFFEKIVSGPKMNREQYERGVAQMNEKQNLNAQLEAKTAESTRAEALQRWLQEQRAAEGAAGRKTQKELAGMEYDLGLRRMENEGSLRRELAQSEAQNRLDAIEREYGLRARLPSERQHVPETKVDFIRQLREFSSPNGSNQPLSDQTSPQVNPNIVNFANSNAAGGPVPANTLQTILQALGDRGVPMTGTPPATPEELLRLFSLSTQASSMVP